MATHPIYPDVLVSAEEVLNLARAGAALVQVDLDPVAYDHGHLTGAVSWNWRTQLRDQDSQEILNKSQFEALLGGTGITPETPVVLYGDNNNWFACWAFWLMKIYRHEDVRLLDGGLRACLQAGMSLTLERPTIDAVEYTASVAHFEDKAETEDVFTTFFSPATHCLLDARSSAEYEGRITGPGVGMESTCEIPGHIPTAINVPWNLNCKPDGTFKSPADLHSLYDSFGITEDKAVITYCAIGERASLSWFVLKHLLGYHVVMNYDRSMAQWSRIANAPIERGSAA